MVPLIIDIQRRPDRPPQYRLAPICLSLRTFPHRLGGASLPQGH